MTTALFAMTLDPNVLASFVSSGQNFSAAMESVMTRVITSGDINWAIVSASLPVVRGYVCVSANKHIHVPRV